MTLDPTELSQALIRCKSVTPEDDGAIAVLEQALEPLGFTCHRLEVDGVQNLYARRGDAGPNLCFAGHTDVVPVGDVDAWAVDPFAGVIVEEGSEFRTQSLEGELKNQRTGELGNNNSDEAGLESPSSPESAEYGSPLASQGQLGKAPPHASQTSKEVRSAAPPQGGGYLVGRGAVDMKPAVAAWVAAVSEGSEISGSLSLLIAGDEEGGGRGTPHVLGWLQERGEVIDACIVGEPTNPDALGEMAKIGRRGSVSFTLTVQGTQGHVAYPDAADNPIPKLIAILHRLTTYVFDEGTEFFPPSNLEVTTVDVGNPVSNVIPAQVVAAFNIRFNDQHSCDSIQQWVQAECAAVTNNFTLERQGGAEAFFTEPGRLSDIVQESVEAVTGHKPELGTTGGTSDARFIKDVCPVVEFGLINKTAHQVNEQVAVSDIHSLTEIYKGIIARYFG